MISYLVNLVKCSLLALLSLASRLFCCGRRRRRHSDQLLAPLHTSATKLLDNVAGASNWGEDDWENCEVVVDRGAAPQHSMTTTDHIAAYRYKVAAERQPSVPEPEPEPDLFSDMEPEIRRQKKVFIGAPGGSGTAGQGSRLNAAAAEPSLSSGPELQDWSEEQQSSGWDEEEITDAALKQHRRAVR